MNEGPWGHQTSGSGARRDTICGRSSFAVACPQRRRVHATVPHATVPPAVVHYVYPWDGWSQPEIYRTPIGTAQVPGWD
jgi:hypothetical protein